MQRRSLLKVLGASACLSPVLLPFHALCAEMQRGAGRRLILIELAGANDGLNTLVPVTNDFYRRHRPNLALLPQDVIMLDDDFAFNRSLQPLMKLWERGELAMLHGLGYPAPNRSHFKSISLWETGGDGQRSARHGWLTHAVEHDLNPQVIDAHGISLAKDMGLFASDSGRWLSISSASQFDGLRLPLSSAWRGNNATLELVSRRMQELELTVNQMADRLGNVPDVGQLPGGELGRQLQQVVRLIRAGVDTPVFRVQLSGFDTHENQSGRHDTLLSRLATAINGLRNALMHGGEWQRTLIMTYSEFGRRVAENGSGGTDHGTAAPHMVAGGAVRGGLYGQATDLSNLIDGDPSFTMDYRALYERVLGDWFKLSDNRFSAYRDSRLDSLLEV